MCPLPNNTQSDGESSLVEQNKSIERSYSPHERLIIQEANKHSKLLETLHSYGIFVERENQFSEWSAGIVCPFPFHKAGKERTGSFGYNFVTDRFNCFGCHKSGANVDFIALKENVDRLVIAEQIVRECVGYLPNNVVLEENIDPKIDKLMFDFSQYIYNKIKENPENIEQIDKVTWWIDDYIITAVPKRKVTVEELSARLSKAKEVLSE